MYRITSVSLRSRAVSFFVEVWGHALGSCQRIVTQGYSEVKLKNNYVTSILIATPEPISVARFF